MCGEQMWDGLCLLMDECWRLLALRKEQGYLDALCLVSSSPVSICCRLDGEWRLPWNCPDMSWEKGADLSSFSDKT